VRVTPEALVLAGGCGDGVSSFVEGVLDFATQEGQNSDDDQGDERDQEAVFNEGLALFFLEKTIKHVRGFCTLRKIREPWGVPLAEYLSNTLIAIPIFREKISSKPKNGGHLKVRLVYIAHSDFSQRCKALRAR